MKEQEIAQLLQDVSSKLDTLSQAKSVPLLDQSRVVTTIISTVIAAILLSVGASFFASRNINNDQDKRLDKQEAANKAHILNNNNQYDQLTKDLDFNFGLINTGNVPFIHLRDKEFNR